MMRRTSTTSTTRCDESRRPPCCSPSVYAANAPQELDGLYDEIIPSKALQKKSGAQEYQPPTGKPDKSSVVDFINLTWTTRAAEMEAQFKDVQLTPAQIVALIVIQIKQHTLLPRLKWYFDPLVGRVVRKVEDDDEVRSMTTLRSYRVM